jgi:sortase A
MAGHVDSKTGPSVFFHLDKLEKGDEVIVKDENGEELTFEVVAKEAYPRKQAPISKIFGHTYRRTLNLITCSGTFSSTAGTHEDRLVVYTQLKEEA